MGTARLETSDPVALTMRDLKTAELLALASARLWVARCLNPDRATPDWDGGFAAAGLQHSAAGDFDALFRTIAAGARRDIEFRCPRCPHLATDERHYLHVLALFQRQRTIEAGGILESWLAPGALRVALSPACRFAAALAWAGLAMPLRIGGDVTPAASICDIAAGRGITLVH